MPIVKRFGVIKSNIIYIEIDDILPPRKQLETIQGIPEGEGVAPILAVFDNGEGKVRIMVMGKPFVKKSERKNPARTLISGAKDEFTLLNGSHFYVSIDTSTIDLPFIDMPEGIVYPGGAVVCRKDASEYGFKATNPDTGEIERFSWVGDRPIRMFMRPRVTDRVANSQEEEATMMRPGFWALSDFGGRSVKHVYRDKRMFDAYWTQMESGAMGATAAWEQHFFLELDAPLVEGTACQVVFPDSMNLQPVSLTYNDRETYTPAIKFSNMARVNAPEKYAYLCCNIPAFGTGMQNGNVPFDDVATNGFQIINDFGKTEFSGPLQLRLAYNEIDVTAPHNDWAASHPYYVHRMNLTGTRRRITGVDVKAGEFGDGIRVFFDGDDIPEGTKIMIEGVIGAFTSTFPGSLNIGLNSHGALPWAANSVDNSPGQKSFLLFTWENKVPLRPSKGNLTDYVSGGTIYECTELRNAAQCDVYGIDFTDFRPRIQGNYRIRIPGLGVSHPILIDESAMNTVARAMNGFFFHQRHFTEFKGEFGVKLPRPNKTILRSRAPCWAQSEYGPLLNAMTDRQKLEIQILKPHEAINETWRVPGEKMDNYVGGTADAGDPDFFHYHLGNGLACVETWLALPNESKSYRNGLPSLEDSFGTKWKGSERLPDFLNHAAFLAESMVPLQHENGLFAGGIQQSSTTVRDPWWSHSAEWYTFKPDHIATYEIVALFAQLNVALREASALYDLPILSERADEFLQRALRGWQAAELLFNDTAACHAYYDDYMNLNNLKEASKVALVQRVQQYPRQHRVLAAIQLLRATESNEFAVAVEEHIAQGIGWPVNDTTALACAAYIGTKVGLPELKDKFEKILVDTCEKSFMYSWEGPGAYKFARYRSTVDGNSFHWYGALGQGSEKRFPFLYYALCFLLTGELRYLRAMQSGLDNSLGANQYGKSMFTAIGHNSIVAPLHINLHVNGIDPAVWNVGVYGARPKLNYQAPYETRANAWKPVATSLEPGSIMEKDKGADVAYPNYAARPIFEHVPEGREFTIESMEFTITQCCASNFIGAALLHLYDGNTQTELNNGKSRIIIKTE